MLNHSHCIHIGGLTGRAGAGVKPSHDQPKKIKKYLKEKRYIHIHSQCSMLMCVCM